MSQKKKSKIINSAFIFFYTLEVLIGLVCVYLRRSLLLPIASYDRLRRLSSSRRRLAIAGGRWWLEHASLLAIACHMACDRLRSLATACDACVLPDGQRSQARSQERRDAAATGQEAGREYTSTPPINLGFSSGLWLDF